MCVGGCGMQETNDHLFLIAVSLVRFGNWFRIG